MGEGMIATDHAGRVTFVNAAAEQLLGWGEGELIGKPGHRPSISYALMLCSPARGLSDAQCFCGR